MDGYRKKLSIQFIEANFFEIFILATLFLRYVSAGQSIRLAFYLFESFFSSLLFIRIVYLNSPILEQGKHIICVWKEIENRKIDSVRFRAYISAGLLSK